MEKSRERSSALPDTSVYSLLKRETSGRPRLRLPTLLTYFKSLKQNKGKKQQQANKQTKTKKKKQRERPHNFAWDSGLDGINTQRESKYVKFAVLVVDDPRAPFSITTTPNCRGRRYSFPWIAPLYLDR